jgi:hypothetical protein
MTIRKLLTLILSCATLLSMTGANAGTLYKSTMANGRVVYSNVPPAGAKTVKQMDSRTRDMGVRIATQEQMAQVENHRNSRRERNEARVIGAWEADSIQDAYEPDDHFSLIFELERKGDGLGGTIREIRGGNSPELTHEIVDARVDEGGVSFYTKHEADAEGRPIPYRTMYRGTVQRDRIAFSRYDNHPKGGLSETFVALRKKEE